MRFYMLLFIILVALIGCEERKLSGCDKLKIIAQDSQKIDYLEKWVSRNTSDKNFLKLIGRTGFRTTPDNFEEISKIDIDWQYLGFNKDHVSIRLNRLTKDKNDFLNSENIKSVSFGAGRNSIIIKVNNSKELGIPGLEVTNKQLKKIGAGIFILCRDNS